MTGPVRVALIGSGIRTSMAPAFHERAAALAGVDLTYDLLDRDAACGDEIPTLIDRCRDDGYTALNITYPFKEIAFGCAVIDDASVRRMGCVNTIVFGSGAQKLGSNTDFSGFLRRWRSRWPDAQPGVVALIGAGGVGKSTGFALGELGASEIRIADSNAARARELAEALAQRFPELSLTLPASAEAAVTGVDGVVNATPVGMYFNPGSPVDIDAIGGQRWLFDVIYSPIETPLVVRARAAGLEVMNGFELFLGQAIDAFERFTGVVLTGDAARLLEREMWQRVAARVI